MESPWRELREDFPALRRYVYLNAAAASPVPRQVADAAAAFYRDIAHGGDAYWDEWLARVEYVRGRVARLINADPDGIAFVPNTSTGMNLIVDLLAGAGPVLSDELEFPAVTLPWIHRGVSVHFLPAIEGVLRLESFRAEHAPRAATIAISHVQFSNGCRQDLPAFGSVKAGRQLVVCGSQSAGAFPVDVRSAQIDAFVSSGHKWLCAGYGAGFVWIARELLEAHPPRTAGWLSVERPFAFDNRRLKLVASNRRTELGCPPFAAIFALGAAVDYLQGIGLSAIEKRVLHLTEYLEFRLKRKGFEPLSPGGAHRSGQTLVALMEPRRAVGFLRERGVLVTEKPEGIRVSTHFYNSEEDVNACVNALVEYRKGVC